MEIMSCKGLGLREREELCVCSFHYIGNECWSSSTGVFWCNNSLEKTFLSFFFFFLQFCHVHDVKASYEQNELKIWVKDVVVMGEVHLGSLGTCPHCSVNIQSGKRCPWFGWMFLSASVENTPKLSSPFLFSVSAEGHPLCFKAFISASHHPPECPVTHEKQLATLQDQSHSLVTGTCSLPQILAALLFHTTFYM